jgi:hypothetical protein
VETSYETDDSEDLPDDDSQDLSEDDSSLGLNDNSDVNSSDSTSNEDSGTSALSVEDYTLEQDQSDTSSETTFEEAFQSYIEENGITLTANDVQFDMQNNIDQNFAIMGTAELSTYYNYGFADMESEYFSVDISPYDGEFSDGWNFYFNRTDFNELYDLLKANGEVTIAATGVIQFDFYEYSQGNLELEIQATWWE